MLILAKKWYLCAEIAIVTNKEDSQDAQNKIKYPTQTKAQQNDGSGPVGVVQQTARRRGTS